MNLFSFGSPRAEYEKNLIKLFRIIRDRFTVGGGVHHFFGKLDHD